jgi:hypothetical protein
MEKIMRTICYKKVGTTRERWIWDRHVNDKWANVEIPVLSDKDSIRAAKALYRKGMGEAWKGEVKIVRGAKYTWIRRHRRTPYEKRWGIKRGPAFLAVNPDARFWGSSRGLKEIIHLISHWCHQKIHPNDAPHSSRQAYLEGELTDYAFSKNLFVKETKKDPTA